MKFKLKAKPQDWLIFGIFLLVLLYATCIFVLNVHSLARNNGFFGLNPFPAFMPGMIGYTIMFFLIFFVGIILTVKSYFFEKEKTDERFFLKSVIGYQLGNFAIPSLFSHLPLLRYSKRSI